MFLLATVTLLPFSLFSVAAAKAGTPVTITVLVALLVCLIPTTIGGLLSAIGIAGMGRMMQANVIATSGRAVEAAGDVDVLLLDKTGTITLGNRQAVAFMPAPGVSEQELADAAQLSSLADETPRAAASWCSRRSGSACASATCRRSAREFVPFTAQTRMSGVDIGAAARSARAPPTRSGATSRARRHASRRAAARRSTSVARARQHAAGGGRRRRGCSA